MLGDGAVAVHPDDARYAPIVGKLVEIPVGPKQHRRLIPIITDEYPDPHFGSGAVKITGAHDFNDYGVATRNNIPLYALMDSKGAMRQDGLSYAESAAIATREEAPAEAGEIGAEYDDAAHCVTLAECPPGLFLWNGTLGFKSEYGAMEPVGISPHHQQWKVGNRVDAYCADSGEYFWGGTSNHDDRAKLLVYPISAETVAMVASHGPSALRAQPPARSGEGQ